MHPMRTLALALLLSPLAAAADLRVELTGSLAPGQSVTRITGDPGRVFSLYISATESPTPISELITLDVNPIRQFAAGVELAGVLDAGGQATFGFTTTESLIGGRLSFQAASVHPTVQVSNLCRGTYLAQNSFGSLPAATASFLGDAFPLPAGRVLFLGGSGPIAQVYDACLQEVQVAGLLPNSNVLASRVQLADGRVLVCGGLDTTGQPSADAFVFDPATGKSSAVGSLATPRMGAAAVLLPTGRVLVTGGLSAITLTDPTAFFDAISNSTEVYDPALAAFSNGPTMPERKAFHSATVLANGAVLVAGGLGIVPILGIPFVSNLGYVTNASAGSFSALPKVFTTGRLLHTATRFADGRVLLAGGLTADLTGVLKTGDLTQIAFVAVAGTSVYSTSGLGSFSNGPTIAAGRALHTATRLASGKVLLAGGLTGSLDLGSIATGKFELPTPVATSDLVLPNAVRPGPALVSARSGASAALLPDGRALILGGGPLQVELYQP
ncbi:MAG: hypothetical protein NTY35_04535 [Planctomycetota bacterium]|nr:hypothetical protein [Planctomycetota bacterium]